MSLMCAHHQDTGYYKEDAAWKIPNKNLSHSHTHSLSLANTGHSQQPGQPSASIPTENLVTEGNDRVATRAP
jgi:hypothetical protein